MDRLTRDEFRQLVAAQEPNSVSLYMPTHRSGKETVQNHIRLKNLLKKAEETLVDRKMRAPQARKLLEPAEPLIDDSMFWSHQSDGLALFFSSQGMRRYRLPQSFEELVVVNDRLHLAPLLPLIIEDARFLVLAVSPKRVRLVESTRDSAAQLNVPDMPASYEELGRYLDEEEHLNLHTNTYPTAGVSVNEAMYHGQGVGTDDRLWKKRMLEYCQMIDNAITKSFVDERIPMVLAGDKNFTPIYREANHYKDLLEEELHGNWDDASLADLRSAAWKCIQPRLEKAAEKEVARYHDARAQGHASDDMEEILVAASDGRVDSLLLEPSAHCWGSFDSGERRADVHASQQNGDEDLVDRAAVLAYTHGGRLHTIEREKMPDHAGVAAIYRY